MVFIINLQNINGWYVLCNTSDTVKKKTVMSISYGYIIPSVQVAWLRVDTQTILTIHNHVISRSRRVGVTHSDQRVWFLHIRELRETDRGWYMCQINTDPMKSQLGYLDVVGKS